MNENETINFTLRTKRWKLKDLETRAKRAKYIQKRFGKKLPNVNAYVDSVLFPSA